MEGRFLHLLIILFFNSEMQKYLTFLSVVIFSVSCKEPYFPKIDNSEKVLVVDALLSDKSNVIKVRLINTAPFRDYANLPEIGAYVVVSDEIGNDYSLNEITPGYYEYNSFKPQYGSTYTLVIRTKANKYYKSTPQTLYPKSLLNSVNSVVTTKIFQTTQNGNLVMKELPGLEFFTTLIDSLDNSPYYRFSSTVLVEYQERKVIADNPDSLILDFHGWRKFFPNQFFNLNEPGYNNLNKHKHSLAFCTVDTSFLSIVDRQIFSDKYPYKLLYTLIRTTYRFAIVIERYHLNIDVHQYYKKINTQLESENRIFDPVSFQILGNISCVNDPDEPVLGVFEVSSCTSRTYSFSDFLYDKDGDFKEIEPLNIE